MAESKKDEANKKSKKIHNKVRVRLPGIESFEKTLEFTAEGPGRVVVRLERLMGSDRIRITDPKYLATLVERLEAEEAESWGSRSRLRKKAEKNRSRQLAIEGLMEPTEDMQDLYEHPVFRVNRVLNRLAVFDSHMSGPRVVNKVPPIVPVEPFAEDGSGKVFKSYNQHQIFHKETLPYDNAQFHAHTTKGELTRQSSRANFTHDSKPEKTSNTSLSSAPPKKETSKTEAGASNGKTTKSVFRAGDDQSSSMKPSEMGSSAVSSAKDPLQEQKDEERNRAVHKIPFHATTLRDFKTQYGVPSEANLVRDWQAFTSHLVESVHEEVGGSAEDLYLLADAVLGAYDRQSEVVDDFMIIHNDKVKEERRAMGLPSDPDVSPPKNVDDADEDEEYGEEGDEEAPMLTEAPESTEDEENLEQIDDETEGPELAETNEDPESEVEAEE